MTNAKPLRDYLPYKTRLMGTPKPQVPAATPDSDPCVPCEIKCIKNTDGRYIYANNPEMLRWQDIASEKSPGVCNMRTRNMKGRYFFTWEHSNWSEMDIYAGYRLVNNGAKDMVVTIYNIGYQYCGEWLGAREWADFYNVEHTLPADYYNKQGEENWYYVGQDFLPHVPKKFEPMTITVPSGKYIWIMGGTVADNFSRHNIGDTADRIVPNGRCMNGVVLFDIEQGEDITGSLYFYTDAKYCDENGPEQGYVVERFQYNPHKGIEENVNFSAQYKGIDDAMGLIETDAGWTVNDLTPAGKLPVWYKNSFDPTVKNFEDTGELAKREPYAVYNSQENLVEGDEWENALNSQNNRRAVGTDMSSFRCITEDGKEVFLTNDCADGAGRPGNFGNWMIPYQDNFTLANTGTKPRTFKIYKKGAIAGALNVVIRDRDGNPLSAKLNCHAIIDKDESKANDPRYVERDGNYWPIVDGRPYWEHHHERALAAEVTVAPNSVEQLTVEYIILGNSNGGIVHWVELV
ncbi:MAG: hypothetical protein FWE06_02580 [Oscillospiraceae bacterium]|nr:hypothetical protein [Oscillospiraceae bacterium]